jgi:spore maturation protein CgeB
MRVALFCHSLLSDWNHQCAHFLRGVVVELLARRHDVCVYEPRDAWSVKNLVEDHGEKALDLGRHVYPRIRPKRYDPATIDLDAALDAVDLVLVHEWNDPDLVRRIGEQRERPGTRFKALFIDTRSRSITDEAAIANFRLGGYDGVLAGSAGARDVYERRSWTKRAWTWHEAADPRVFFPVPPPPQGKEGDVVWVGNWGDGDRADDLRELFQDPVRDLGLRARAYGARYPKEARDELVWRGIAYAGWVPNFDVPDVFARFKCTVHVPRRPSARATPGVPSIRVFEALACAIPLVSGPWDDDDGLFTPGRDYLVAEDGVEMRRHLSLLVNDAHARSELSRHGRATILARHTCAHRVDELIAVAGDLGVRVRRPVLASEGAVP